MNDYRKGGRQGRQQLWVPTKASLTTRALELIHEVYADIDALDCVARGEVVGDADAIAHAASTRLKLAAELREMIPIVDDLKGSDEAVTADHRWYEKRHVVDHRVFTNTYVRTEIDARKVPPGLLE